MRIEPNPKTGYTRQCPQCPWKVTKPDDLDGRREADRIFDLHRSEHARLNGTPVNDCCNFHAHGGNALAPCDVREVLGH